MAVVNAAHNDGENQVFSMLGVIGTLGTADTTGTAKTLPVGVNPDTGAMYVDVMDTTFNVGTLTVGTIDKVTELTKGSISVIAGTVNTGTINAGTINTGTINAGTINSATVTAGSIVVTNGTIGAGSISVIAGTMNTGTLNAGTIDLLKAGTLTELGTISNIGMLHGGTVSVSGTIPASISGGTLSINQDVTADDNNSSTANLAPSATYTGTATSTLGVAGIQVSLKTDQNCSVYVDQSPDGTQWDIVDTYNYYAAVGNFGVTVQAINSYVRVRVTNTGAGTTTYFRLQTALCPIVEAVPRSLDTMGNLKVGVKNIYDGYGFEVENTPMGEMRTVEPYRLVGASFSGTTLDSNFWTSTLGTGGTALVENAQVQLYNGTTANNTSSIQSVRSGRYMGGASNRYRAVIRLSDATIDKNVRRWGAFDANDGAFFQLAGTSGTAFSVVTRKATADSAVSSGSFNGNLGAVYTPDTNVKTYEIYWTNSKVWFTIGGTVLHTSTAATTTWSSTMTLPIRTENNSTGGGVTNTSVNVRTATIYRLGAAQSDPIWKHSNTAGTTTYKNGAGRLHKILVNNPTNNAFTIYDSVGTSTNVVAVVDPDTGATPFVLDYEVPFYSGLTVVTAGTPDLTLVYE